MRKMPRKKKKEVKEEEKEDSTMEVEKKEEEEDEKMEEDLFGGEDDEDDSETKKEQIPSEINNLLTSLGVTHDVFASSQPMNRSRLNTLLQGLKSEGNEDIQLQCLFELCDFLSVGTEENMSNFAVDSFVPPLVSLLQVDYNPELMLISCRALTYLMEALPSASSYLVNHGAIPPLCAKLLSIDYIDLAEQSIQCLEKISYEYSSVILQSGGLSAVLSFLDFFATNTQRLCVNIAANICRQITEANFHYVEEVIPILQNLLEYSDQKVVEKTVICFARLSDIFYGNEAKLKSICSSGLLSKLCNLVISSSHGHGATTNTPSANVSVSSAVFTLVLRLLSTFSSISSLSTGLMNEGIVDILKGLLSGHSSSSSISTPSTETIPLEQLNEILNLVNELLPPLPDDVGAFLQLGSGQLFRSANIPQRIIDRLNAARESLQESTNAILNENSSESTASISLDAPIEIAADLSSDQVDYSVEEEEEYAEDEDFTSILRDSRKVLRSSGGMASTQSNLEKEKAMSENPQLIENFGSTLLQPLFVSFTTSVNSVVKAKILSAISKILVFSPDSVLKEVLKNLSVSSFVANLLVSNDLTIVATAVQICEILMKKLPQVFSIYFKREGVVFEIQNLIRKHQQKDEQLKTETSTTPSTPTPSAQPSNYLSLFLTPGGNGREEMIKTLPRWIWVHSKRFYSTHFEGKEELKSKEFDRLSSISKEMSLGWKNETSSKDQTMSILSELLDLMSNEGMSTFELLGSGILQSLLTFLTGLRFSSSESTQSKGEEIDSMDLEESKLPFSVFQDRVSALASLLVEKNDQALKFVSKLQQTINRVEKIPVISNEVSGTAAGLKLLTQPFKLKLSKSSEETDPNVSDYSASVVLIEPLASIRSISEFINGKVYKSLETSNSSKGGKFSLYYEGNKKELDPEDNIFKVVEREARSQYLKDNNGAEGSSPFLIYRLWEKVHNLSYHKLEEENVSGKTEEGDYSQKMEIENETVRSNPSEVYVFQSIYEQVHNEIISQFKNQRDTFNDSQEEPFIVSLGLLKIIHHLCFHYRELVLSDLLRKLPKGNGEVHPLLSPTEFNSTKLSAKLVKQVQDPLILVSGAFPEWANWLLKSYPFLFSCETRRLFFSCTTMGVARALHYLQQHLVGTNVSIRGHEFKVGRIPRQKVRLSRKDVIPSAVKVMELYSRAKSLIEVEYFGEVGTGLGPTLEFFTLVCNELQMKERGLWRDTKGGDGNVVHTSGGLWPSLLNPSDDGENTNKKIKLFKFLGSFVAKAIVDNRLLDLPLARPFFKFIAGKPLSFEDLKEVDIDFASSMEKLMEVAKAKIRILESNSMDQKEKNKLVQELRVGGAKVEDLSLDFTVSGLNGVELQKGGSSKSVTIDNLDEYLDLNIKFQLKEGVERQLASFAEGFNYVLDMKEMSLFRPEEIETLHFGTQEASWDTNTLMENTKCEHGFTHHSPTVSYLFDVLSEFTMLERRDFLLFVTGSPRLPAGGFSSLDPKLTIVRKEPDREHPDSYLPSVNCCFYYLKLPEYSSKQVLKEKLIFAIQHGQGAFSFN
eukprot:TRINITY_DN1420_c0_g1_i2.p1 TRINITY_DN1420_c0_g1~~TRINITY_DN1420_c0_g1_i2.p1  ORF type:complete len:1554 (+),score=499.41 TRINITY_DN1420_c0_g1_i2:246-4907(+)